MRKSKSRANHTYPGVHDLRLDTARVLVHAKREIWLGSLPSRYVYDDKCRLLWFPAPGGGYVSARVQYTPNGPALELGKEALRLRRYSDQLPLVASLLGAGGDFKLSLSRLDWSIQVKPDMWTAQAALSASESVGFAVPDTVWSSGLPEFVLSPSGTTHYRHWRDARSIQVCGKVRREQDEVVLRVYDALAGTVPYIRVETQERFARRFVDVASLGDCLVPSYATVAFFRLGPMGIEDSYVGVDLLRHDAASAATVTRSVSALYGSLCPVVGSEGVNPVVLELLGVLAQLLVPDAKQRYQRLPVKMTAPTARWLLAQSGISVVPVQENLFKEVRS